MPASSRRDATSALIALEGTNSYGATHCSVLTDGDCRIVDAPHPTCLLRRRKGKTAQVDAGCAAPAVLRVGFNESLNAQETLAPE